MSDKKPTQAMPQDGFRDPPDRTIGPARVPSGTSAADDASSGATDPKPHDGKNSKKDDAGSFHGGQSDAAYYGPEQLGDEVMFEGGNPNAASREG
jgi:hypothetical protein